MSTLPFERIVAEIKRLGLSERGACAAAGLDASTLAKARGREKRLDLDTIAKLCAMLQKPVGWALGEAPAGGEPAGAAVAPPAAGLPADADRLLVPLARLVHSDLNPRKTFDELGDIHELADSIKASGVLQNLVVRTARETDLLPPNADLSAQDLTKLVVVAGERRLRALRQLANAGDWDPHAATVPVKLITAGDAEHLVLALLENLQRRDMNALEEAEAFKKLQAIDPKVWTTAAIAKRIGFTQRHVQIRMKLATDLIPEARDALRDGKINTAQARVIVLTDAKKQKEMLKRATDDEYPEDAQSLKETVTHRWFPVARAIFPLEGAGAPDAGEIFEDETTGEKWFINKDRFIAAQSAAASVQAEQTRKGKGYAFKKKIDHYNTYSWVSDKKNPDSGVVYTVDQYSGNVTLHTGVREKTKAEQRAPSVPGHKETAEDKAARQLAAKRAKAYGEFGTALGDAARKQPDLALQLAAFSIVCDVEDTDLPFEDGGVFGIYQGDRKGFEVPAKVESAGEDAVALWKAVVGLTENQLHKLLAQAIATKFLDGNGWMPEAPDCAPGSLCRLVADAAGVEIPEVLLPRQADIEEAVAKSKKKAAE